MTYFQFIHAVETKVKKEVEEEKTVSIHTNVKNNGVRRSGIMISEKGINISPTIYLEEYFHQFRIQNTDQKSKNRLQKILSDYMRKSGFRIHGRTVKR